MEKIIKLLAKDNIVYCYLEKEYKCFYGINNNIIYRYYDESIDIKLKSLLPKYTKYLKKEVCTTINEIVLEMSHSLEYMLEGSMFYVENLINTIEEINPDLILRDSCSLFGRIIADKLNIKVYGYVSSPAITDKYVETDLQTYLPLTLQRNLDMFNEFDLEILYKKLKNTYEEICKNKEIRPFPINYLTCPDEEYNFCFGSYALNYIHHDEKIKYICMKPKMFDNDFNETKKDSVVVSTGTIVSFPIKIYNYIINAFKNSNTSVYISQKYAETNVFSFNNLLKNIKISSRIDQCKLVSESKLLITHGGYNSVLEAIYYHTPVLIYPICNDQLFIAKKVQELDIGINLSGIKLSGKSINTIANKIIKSEIVLSNLTKIKEEIKTIDNENILRYFK